MAGLLLHKICGMCQISTLDNENGDVKRGGRRLGLETQEKEIINPNDFIRSLI